MENELKLNIGCGYKPIEWWIGIDKGNYGHNIVRDLKRGLPFSDNTISHIKADSVLEHIADNDDFAFVMNECLRVLKPGGEMYIRVPHWRGRSAHKDPTHCRYFDRKTFSYFDPSNKWEYGFDKRWKEKVSKNFDDEILEFWLIADK